MASSAGEPAMNQGEGPPLLDFAGTLILDFSASRTIRNVHCLSHSIYGIFDTVALNRLTSAKTNSH